MSSSAPSAAITTSSVGRPWSGPPRKRGRIIRSADALDAPPPAFEVLGEHRLLRARRREQRARVVVAARQLRAQPELGRGSFAVRPASTSGRGLAARVGRIVGRLRRRGHGFATVRGSRAARALGTRRAVCRRRGPRRRAAQLRDRLVRRQRARRLQAFAATLHRASCSRFAMKSALSGACSSRAVDERA